MKTNHRFLINITLILLFLVSILALNPTSVNALNVTVTVNSISTNYSPNPAIAGQTLTISGTTSVTINVDSINGCATLSGSATLYVSQNGGSYIPQAMSISPGWRSGTNTYTISANLGTYGVGTVINYYVIVSASNNCDTGSLTSGTTSFNVVSTAPTISNMYISPPDPTPYDPVNVYATITDTAGLSKFTLYYSTPTTSNSISKTYSGTYFSGTIGTIPQFSASTTVNFYIVAWDSTGSLSKTGPTHTYTVDGTGPFITNIAYTPTNPTSSQVVTVTATITDAISGVYSATVYYSTNGGSSWFNSPMSSSGASFTGTLLNEPYGTNVIFYIQAVDNAGNIGGSQFVNGGFETGSFQAWTTDYASISTSPYTAKSGTYGVELDRYDTSNSLYYPAYIQQGFQMPVSQFSSMSFWLDFSPLKVTFGYTDGSTTIFNYGSTSGWYQYLIPQSKLSAGNTISFVRFESTASGTATLTGLDNIVVTPQVQYGYTVSADTTPPVISNIIRNIQNPNYTDSVMVNATITDADSGVNYATLFYSINSGSTWNQLAMTADGNNYSATIGPQSYNTQVKYYISAFDNSGNNQVSSTYSYTITDTIVPDISSVSFSPTVPSSNQNVLVSAVVSDSGSGVQNATIYYTINGGSESTISMNPQSGNVYQGTIPGQSSGSTVQFYIVAYDNADNMNQTALFSYSIIDNTPPTIVINEINPTSPQDYDIVTVNATITDQGSGVQSANLSYSTDNGASWTTVSMINSGGNFYLGTIPAQSYYTTVDYKITAVDNVGNIITSSESSYEVLDTFKPVISQISINPNKPNPNQMVFVSANITDVGSGLQNETLYYSIDNGNTWFTISMINVGGTIFNATIPGQSYGTLVSFYIVAFDNANNKAQSKQYKYTINDTIPPSISNVNIQPSKPQPSDSVAVIATITDIGSGVHNATLFYQINSGSWVSTKMNFLSGSYYGGTIPSQAYLTNVSFYIVVFDNANNSAQTTIHTYQVGDFSPPTISNVLNNPTDPQNTDTVFINATITDNISGVANATLYYSSNSGSTWNSEVMQLLQGNIYNGTIPNFADATIVLYYIRSYDNAGNSIDSQQFNYTIVDTIAPTISGIKYTSSVQPHNQDIVNATITDFGSGVNKTILFYSIDSGTSWQSITMVNSTVSFYKANLPGQNNGVTILFYIQAIDNAGNIAQSKTFQISVIDTIPPSLIFWKITPTIQIYTQPTTVYYNISDTGSGIQTATLYYSIDSGVSWTAVSLQYLSSTTYFGAIPSLPYNTNVSYYVNVVDNAGNGISSKIRNFTVMDTIPPVVSGVTRYPLAPTSSDTVVINATITDIGSGVKNVTLYYGFYGSSIWNSTIMNYVGGIYNATILAQLSGTTIQYYIRSFDYSGNNATSSVYSYTSNDTSPPVISGVTLNPSKPVYNFPVYVSAIIGDIGSGIQNATIYYRISTETTWSTSMMKFQSGWYQGSIPTYPYGTIVSYYISAFDNAGNNATTITYTYTVMDTTSPTIININQNPTNAQPTDSVVVSAGVSDDGSGLNQVILHYSINDGSSWFSIAMSLSGGAYSGSIPQQPYSTTVSYYITATDNAGNIETSSTFSYLVGDTIPPIISGTTFSPTSPQPNQQVSVTTSVSDSGSGVKQVTLYYSIDNGANWISIAMTHNSGTQYSAIISGMTDKTNVQFKIQAIDNAGNTINTIVTSYTVADTIPPAISNVLQNPATPIYTENVNITATISDSSSGVNKAILMYSTDSGNSWIPINMISQGSGKFNATIPIEPYGVIISYKIEAFDNDGNVKTSSIFTYAVSDPFPPNITNIAYSPSNPIYTNDVLISANITDNGSGIQSGTLSYSIDNGNTWNILTMNHGINNIYQVSIPPESYGTLVQYKLIATDNAGNTITSSIFSYLVGDTIAPIISNINQNPTIPSYNENVVINATVLDSGSGVQTASVYYSLDQISWTQITLVLQSNSVYQGYIPAEPFQATVYYYISSFDKAENSFNTSVYSYTVIDSVSPVISVSSTKISYELGSTDNSINWKIQDISPNDYFIYKDEVLIKSGTYESNPVISINIDGLSIGTYNYTIVANDSSNNIASLSVFVTVSDTTAPIFLSTPDNITYSYGSIGNNLAWIAFDLSNGTYNLFENQSVTNSGTWTSGNPMKFVVDGFSVGIYNFTLQLTDPYGNQVSNTVWVTVQSTSTISFDNIKQVPKNVTDKNTITITVSITSTLQLSKVVLHYSVNSSTEIEVVMTHISNNNWKAVIGPFEKGDIIVYYIRATDSSGYTQKSSEFQFTVTSKNSGSHLPGFDYSLSLIGLSIIALLISFKKKRRR